MMENDLENLTIGPSPSAAGEHRRDDLGFYQLKGLLLKPDKPWLAASAATPSGTWRG